MYRYSIVGSPKIYILIRKHQQKLETFLVPTRKAKIILTSTKNGYLSERFFPYWEKLLKAEVRITSFIINWHHEHLLLTWPVCKCVQCVSVSSVYLTLSSHSDQYLFTISYKLRKTDTQNKIGQETVPYF